MAKREKLIAALALMFIAAAFTGCGPTPAEQSLLDAVAHEDPNTIKSLLEGDPELANAQDKKGNSALHHAIIWGDTEVIKMLIANGQAR